MAPPLVQVSYLRPDVKTDEEKPSRPQYPVYLSECRAQLVPLKMDNRIKGNRRPELTVCGREFQQVPLAEFHLRVFPAAHRDRGRGQVDTDHGKTPPGQPGCDVPGAAAQIGNWRAVVSLFGQASQQGPVERLTL